MSAGAGGSWELLLEENLRLRGEVAECHELLAELVGGQFDYRVLVSLCDRAAMVLGRARIARGNTVPAPATYAEMDARLGVNRPRGGAVNGDVVVNQPSPDAHECPQCRDYGWSGSGER